MPCGLRPPPHYRMRKRKIRKYGFINNYHPCRHPQLWWRRPTVPPTTTKSNEKTNQTKEDCHPNTTTIVVEFILLCGGHSPKMGVLIWNNDTTMPVMIMMNRMMMMMRRIIFTVGMTTVGRFSERLRTTSIPIMTTTMVVTMTTRYGRNADGPFGSY